MCPHTPRALVALAILSSCAPPPIDEPPLAYPAPDVAASCATSPTLCGVTLHDLGGGDHPNAFHIVLIGDGYLDDEQEQFAWQANFLASAIQRPDGVFTSTDLVARAPEMFHFWRVDVPSDSIEVDDDVLTNTPLGAHLGTPDNCVGKPLIRAIEDRFALALDNAALVPIEEDDLAARRRYGRDDAGLGDVRADEVIPWPGAPVTSSRATFVMLSHRSVGRANAAPGGNVRMSSVDDVGTMAHELGHALFHLGDEYTEFPTCAPSPLPITCGPPFDISEVGLLETANTSTLHDGSKWSNDVDGSVAGGNRWPCHAHPTNECLMLGGNGLLCPACASAVEERFARRRCLDDTRPPRVAIEKDPAVFAGGTRALVAASAFDERALGSDSLAIGWTVDGAPIAGAAGPFAVLDLAAVGGRAVRATASDGRFTQASSPLALPFSARGGEAEDDAQVLALGPLRASSTPVVVVDDDDGDDGDDGDGDGDVVQIVSGVGRRVALDLSPLACATVMRAGITVRSNGGPLKTKDISLPQPLRVNCGPAPSRLYVTYEPDADAGEEIEVRGFMVDGKGRRAETEAWHPVVVADDACALGIDATRATGSSDDVLGAFDPIVLEAPSNALDVDVRVGHARANTMGNVVMPVGLPTSTGSAIEVDVLASCDIGWVAASTRIDVRWDNEAPAIAAQTSLAPFADAWEITVIDDSAIASVTVGTKDSTPLVLTAPPWVLSPPPLGELVISATDVAGNKSTRVVDVTQQDALDRDVVCP